MNKTTLKSIWAVAAGFLAIIVLASAADMILEANGVFPTVEEQQKHGFVEPWMQYLTLGYRLIFTVIAGAITAKLAPNRPMRHVIILGIVGTVVGIVGSIAVASLGIFPLWYSIALVAISLPAVWLGGKLVTKRSAAPAKK